MDRREFLLATGSSLAVTSSWGKTACAFPVSTQPAPAARRLTLSVAGADGMGWTVVQAHDLARRIEQASEGRFAIDVVNGAGGLTDLSLASATELVDRDRGFAFATGLPGRNALDATALDTWLTSAGAQPLLDDLAAAHGLKVLLAAHSGESLLWSKAPIATPQDVAGKVVHAGGLARSVAAGLGAEPWRILPETPAVHFASGELIALEASVIDAMSQQIVQHAVHASSNALAPHGTAAALTIRLDVWQSLSPAGRAVFATAARENYRETVSLNRRYESLNRRALAQSFGIVVAPVPVSLAAAIETVSGAVIAAASATSLAAQNLNASYMSFLLNPLNSNGENLDV